MGKLAIATICILNWCWVENRERGREMRERERGEGAKRRRAERGEREGREK